MIQTNQQTDTKSNFKKAKSNNASIFDEQTNPCTPYKQKRKLD
jgi:hypothetical protein